jgi:hypothetical protein
MTELHTAGVSSRPLRNLNALVAVNLVSDADRRVYITTSESGLLQDIANYNRRRTNGKNFVTTNSIVLTVQGLLLG